MGIFNFIADKNREREAKEHLRRYLEEQYNVEIHPKFKAYCICYKGRICKFLYTLEEVRAYLEGSHPSFEDLWKANGFRKEEKTEEVVEENPVEESVKEIKEEE